MSVSRKNIIRAILLIFITAVVAAIYFLGFFTPYNYLTAECDIYNNKLVFVDYGEPIAMGREINTLSKEYGLIYEVGGGCTFHGPKANGIDCYNQIMMPYLDHKLGRDWKEKLYIRADSLYYQDRINAMQKAVLSQEYVKGLDKYLDSISRGKTRVSVWILSKKEYNEKFKEGYIENASMGWIRPDSTKIIVQHYCIDPRNLNVGTIVY